MEIFDNSANHMLNWALNDSRSYNALQKLATLGNYVGSVDRYSDASKLAIKVYAAMRKAGDMPHGFSGYNEITLALATVLFLQYRPER